MSAVSVNISNCNYAAIRVYHLFVAGGFGFVDVVVASAFRKFNRFCDVGFRKGEKELVVPYFGQCELVFLDHTLVLIGLVDEYKVGVAEDAC